MKKIPTFSKEVRDAIYEAQNGRCKLCLDGIDDYHHRISNSITNQKLFPLFLQSVFAAVGLCRSCHESEAIYLLKITMKEAMAYENYLAELVARVKKGEEG
jgi:hypothetical protein